MYTDKTNRQDSGAVITTYDVTQISFPCKQKRNKKKMQQKEQTHRVIKCFPEV
jgi:hypothetical protein